MSQQDNCEDTKQTESLVDLEVTAEQADETKAGTGAHSIGGGHGAGKATFQDLH